MYGLPSPLAMELIDGVTLRRRIEDGADLRTLIVADAGFSPPVRCLSSVERAR